MGSEAHAMLEHLEQQKALTVNQWKIFAAATIGDMLDFFDFLLIAFVLAFIVKDWNLTYGQSGAILLSSGISAPLGSLFYGWLADKIGRRKVMIATVLNFSIATGLMALTPEHGWVFLVICRFLVGFGVTGLYTVDIAVVQEFVPASRRGWITGGTTTMLPAGFLLGPASFFEKKQTIDNATKVASFGTLYWAHLRLGRLNGAKFYCVRGGFRRQSVHLAPVC